MIYKLVNTEVYEKENLNIPKVLCVSIFPICSFLHSLDITIISLQVNENKVYKKRTFYTYAVKVKCSLGGENTVSLIRSYLFIACYTYET